MSSNRTAKVRLSTKGQLVLPREIRERHGWRAGTELVVSETPAGVLIRSPDPVGTLTIDDLIGCLPYSGPPRTIEEMDAGIAREARRRHGRSKRARRAA